MYCKIKLGFNNLQQHPQLYSILKKQPNKCGSSSIQVKLKQDKETWKLKKK